MVISVSSTPPLSETLDLSSPARWRCRWGRRRRRRRQRHSASSSRPAGRSRSPSPPRCFSSPSTPPMMSYRRAALRWLQATAAPPTSSSSCGSSTATRSTKGGSYGPSACVVKLELLAAKNLIAANLNGTSGPYALITCGEEKRFSSMVPGSRNPMWGEEFNFFADNLPVKVIPVPVKGFIGRLTGISKLSAVQQMQSRNQQVVMPKALTNFGPI